MSATFCIGSVVASFCAKIGTKILEFGNVNWFYQLVVPAVEKLLQGREPTTNSAHIMASIPGINPGTLVESVCSHQCHPCLPILPPPFSVKISSAS